MPSRRRQQQNYEEDDPLDAEDVDAEEAMEGEVDVHDQLRRLIDPNYAEKFVAGLHPAVQSRVRALQGMQTSINEIREKYLAEHKAIEKKFEALYAPIFAKRAEILSGKREPTSEEVQKGQGEDFKEPEDANQETSEATGVPEFWLTALKNHDTVAEFIEERDEDCLKSLVNITAKNFDDPDTGFTLEFHFAENEYFTNTLLTKTYHLVDEDEVVLDKAEGCEVNWKSGKNLTVELKKKKVKGRGGKGSRQVTKEEPCDSFFNFFKPPQIPDGMDDEEDDEDELGETLEEKVEQDYEVGCAIKDQIVPKAVLWFTGEAADHDEDDDDEDEDDDEEEASSDDDDSEDEPPPRRGGKRPPQSKQAPKGAQPECKQQ